MRARICLWVLKSMFKDFNDNHYFKQQVQQRGMNAEKNITESQNFRCESNIFKNK